MSSVVITEKVNAGGTSIEQQNTFSETDEKFTNIVSSVADSQTDQLCNCSLDVSTLKALYILSDQDLTMETNAVDATGGNTIALLAGIPYIWFTGKYEACLLTLDVTKLYLTNASGSTATFKLIALEDNTP